MVWKIDGPVGEESAKIVPFVVPYTRGRGLDLGCGPSKFLPHAIGMDQGQLYGPRESPDIIGDIRDLKMFADASLDFVFSSHALEDLEDTRAALTEWWRVIKPGGYLSIYLPHKDLYPNIGQPGANPNHKHDFLPADILDHMQAVASVAGTGCAVLEDETRSGGDEYSFLQVYRKTPAEDGWSYKPWRRQPASTLVIRFGGWGDMAVLSSVLPLLKQKGRHVTVSTTPRGMQFINGNPHVDAVLIQDTDQIPNPCLGQYWEALATRYDEVINLSGSVEDSLLATYPNVQHGWPAAARRKILGVNYYERTHDICGVPYVFRPQFFALDEEHAKAEAEKIAIGKPVVLLVLQGSSVHKLWPHADAFIAQVLLRTNCSVVTVGDAACEFLERPWQNEPRVIGRSGKWSIRETLAFALQCEIVVGPETGVLNAVSAEPMRKVCLLSHSSHENLTKHWVNTVAIEPDVSCFSCHQMHYGWDYCHQHHLTHAAICATAIGADTVFDAAFSIKRMEGAKAIKAPLWRASPEMAAAVAAEAASLAPSEPRTGTASAA